MIDAISLFCDDAREEVRGATTLIGVFPDNIEVPAFPGALPKLCVYTRVNASQDEDIKSIQVKLRLPGGGESVLGTFDGDILKQTIAEASDKDSPIIGFIIVAISSPFNVHKAGRINCFTVINGVERLSGSLNLVAPAAG